MVHALTFDEMLICVGTPWPLAALGALATGAALAALIERFTWRWMMAGAKISGDAFDMRPLTSRSPRPASIGSIQ
jgi:hypothetical protein